MTTLSAAIIHDAHIPDSIFASQPLHDALDTRQLMEMLMAIEMRDAQPCGENALDLRAKFGFHVLIRKQEPHPVAWHLFASRERALFDKREMHADLERWNIFEPRDCIREFIAVRDDRAGRHDAVAMRFDGA